MIRDILVSLVVVVIFGGCCSAPTLQTDKYGSILNEEQEVVIPLKPIRLKSGKMVKKTSQGEYKDVRFDVELGFYTGRKGAGVFILDSHEKAISDGFHRIYRQEGLLIGEKGASMYILDPTTYRPSTDGYHRIYRGEYGHLIGSKGSAEYVIDCDGRKQYDYREFKQSITTATSACTSPSMPSRNRDVETRNSGTPEWMKPFAEVDMFGKPTIFYRGNRKR